MKNIDINANEVITGSYLGNHLLCEFYNCDPSKINDLEIVSEALLDAAEKCNVTVLEKSFHKFSPQGVSGVVIIAESHISIHTWPEYNYAAVDFFTCSQVCKTESIIDNLKNKFASETCMSLKINRGRKG